MFHRKTEKRTQKALIFFTGWDEVGKKWRRIPMEKYAFWSGFAPSYRDSLCVKFHDRHTVRQKLEPAIGLSVSFDILLCIGKVLAGTR